MKLFTQLTLEQRYKLEALLKVVPKMKQKEIALHLGVSESTISREKKRYSKPRVGYRACDAQRQAEKKCRRCPYKMTQSMISVIRPLLEKDFSPQQVVGRLAIEETECVCHETIYQYIYRQQKKGDRLYMHLRRKRKKRRKRLKTADLRGKIPNKTMIDQRPLEVENKERIGDWEGDTIIGANHQGAILTLVERVSKYTLVIPLEAKTAQEVEVKIITEMKKTNLPIHTITFDNGREFTNHQIIAQQLNTKIFFAHPYHSWERGLNENTNGLIRQYIPKKQDFKELTNDYIYNVQNKLNNRPRKTLNFLTPIEFIQKQKIAFQN
ncbi:IS30 family transposase [Runella sp.]|jgi:IS30 family transposase|uniref:IS30 family transposase n=1 Tax=Runella sp. TaxID=1960881 RepID=UPI00301B06DA